MYFKGSQVDFLNYNVVMLLYVVLIIVNSVCPDDMQHHAAYHQGLHCLPKYSSRRFKYVGIKQAFWVRAAATLCAYGFQLMLLF